jgi:hypothetical protein
MKTFLFTSSAFLSYVIYHNCILFFIKSNKKLVAQATIILEYKKSSLKKLLATG